MPRSVDPRTWAQVSDPLLRQALKELADRLEEVDRRAPRGFLAYRAADLTGLGNPAFLPMDGFSWNARPEGPQGAAEYYIPEPGSANQAHWRPSKPGVPWLVFASMRVTSIGVGYALINLVDLNQTAPVVARLGEQIPNGSAAIIGGQTIITPRQGQRFSLQVEVSSWASSSGTIAGGASFNSTQDKPFRSYWGAICLQP